MDNLKALELFKQDNCSVVTRAFIRYIEPHKQTRHLCNGKTKPGWWSPDVSYNGPDQLGKPSKADYTKLPRLFVSYILILTYVVSGSQLKEPSRLELIYDILRVGKTEEQLEDGALRMY